MSSRSEQSLIETEALARSDTEVMNTDGNDGLGGEFIHIFLSTHPRKKEIYVHYNTIKVHCNQTKTFRIIQGISCHSLHLQLVWSQQFIY